MACGRHPTLEPLTGLFYFLELVVWSFLYFLSVGGMVIIFGLYLFCVFYVRFYFLAFIFVLHSLLTFTWPFRATARSAMAFLRLFDVPAFPGIFGPSRPVPGCFRPGAHCSLLM